MYQMALWRKYTVYQNHSLGWHESETIQIRRLIDFKIRILTWRKLSHVAALENSQLKTNER